MQIELRHLVCGYESGAPVLEDCSFAVNSGEICCLLGPNGVGKTTLFKTVLNLLPPLSGKVLINGEDSSKWSAAKLAEHMAYVAQNHKPPFAYKIQEVVMMGRLGRQGCFAKVGSNDEIIVENILKEMGLYEMQERPYTEISGGERQLVLIARALAQQPGFLVLDEPTASLDYGNSVKVIKKILELKERGLGIIMTTHSPEQAFQCNSKTAMLFRNAPVLYGDTIDVATEKNLLALYGIPIRVLQFTDETGLVTYMCSPCL